MSAKAQHAPKYALLPNLLRNLREEAKLTQRHMGTKMSKPQSWAPNGEVPKRRVDVTEFVLWCRGCGIDPLDALKTMLDELF